MSRLFPAILAGALVGFAASHSLAMPIHPRPLASLDGSASDNLPPVVRVQSADQAFRINQLEEQMRALNGKVEEMTFQLLQLQEQIRRMQEDNEFRFQELENRGDAQTSGSSDVAGGGNSMPGKQQPSGADSETTVSGGNSGRSSIGDIIGSQSQGEPGSSEMGAPPIDLGTLTFDENGNLKGAGVGKPMDLTGSLQQPAGLPDAPDQLFALGYEYVQAGAYEEAQSVFESYRDRFPGDDRASEVNFWLGESLFAQGDYQAAARIFLDNHKTYPQGNLAAQNLLKLGVALSGLGQRELACATLAEVPKKYPSAANAVLQRVRSEQNSAQCQAG